MCTSITSFDLEDAIAYHFDHGLATTESRPISAPHSRASACEPQVKRAEALEDIRLAEEQIARGEGIEHDEAMRRTLARLRL